MEQTSTDHIDNTDENAQEGTDTTQTGGSKWKQWTKRFGMAGFFFFLIKGLLWLTVPFLAVYFGCE